MTADSTPPDVPFRLARHPFFEGMDADFVARLSAIAHERSFEPGTFLVREGDPAEEFWLLFSGKVAIEIVLPGRPRTTVQTLGSGDIVGWSWLIAPFISRFDARAVKATRALGIRAASLRSLLNDDPTDGYRLLLRLLPVIAERLENTQLQLLDLHGA